MSRMIIIADFGRGMVSKCYPVAGVGFYMGVESARVRECIRKLCSKDQLVVAQIDRSKDQITRKKDDDKLGAYKYPNTHCACQPINSVFNITNQS